MILKTLNDLKITGRMYFMIKKLAIKWLKEDLEVLERLHEDDKSTWEISLKRWKARLNISEEDLK